MEAAAQPLAALALRPRRGHRRRLRPAGRVPGLNRWFGTGFILDPETSAQGFGLPHPASGDGGGFLIVKGVRDVVLALFLARPAAGLTACRGVPAGQWVSR
ncbi:DUF4267 domain-containing protein [Streptomyces aquilus]|uniref:DUF4267 domain-containing protein n=1 Tax=Streptomyces aquilus TaxID=2548456 RepID=UPI0036A24362